MFVKIGKLSAHYPKSVLMIWVAILVVAVLFSPKLKDHLTVGGFSDPKSESVIADNKIKEGFSDVFSQRVILVIENKHLDTSNPSFANSIKLIEKKVKEERMVKRTQSAFSTNSPSLIVPKKHRAYIYVDLNSTDNEALTLVENLRKSLGQPHSDLADYNILVSGGPGIYYDVNTASKESVSNVEKIGLPIVFLLLLFVFRSVLAALLPLIIGVFSILVTMAIIYFLTPFMQLSTLLTNIVTMLGLGISIDYALFITQRFREEIAANNDKKQAVINSISSSGRSVFFAGLTIAVSLVSLLVPNTLLFRSVAIGGFVVVIISILTAITLLPAILNLLGKRVDLLRIPQLKKSVKPNGFWEKLIRIMMKRTAVFLIVGLVLVSTFLPFMPKMEMHVPVAAFNELTDKSDAKKGMESVIEDFGVGNTFPIRILLESKTGDVYSKDSIRKIYSLTEDLKKVSNVSDVKGLTSLDKRLTTSNQYEMMYSDLTKLPESSQKQLKTIVSTDRHKTILYVIPKTAPNSPEARELVKTIRNLYLPKVNDQFKSYVGGETAVGLDYDQKIINEIPKVIGICLTLSFILLMVAFRSILLPIKAILLNGLVTINTLGFLVYMFQNGNMPGTIPQALNINTPVLLFCILFGLSIDYEVIIVSRIREFYNRFGNHNESIVSGFHSTAGMINGAASIMITVFAVFIFADIQIVQELGVGLAVAILMDAVVVRTIIVPLTMKLMGRLSWWFPFIKHKKKEEYDNKNMII